MKLLFYHSTKRINNKGKAPIYGRITISNVRADFSTGIFVEQKNYCNEKITTNTSEADLQNAELTRIKNYAFAVYYDFKNKGEPLSAARLKNIVTGSDVVNPTFIDVCHEYMTYFENTNVEVGTITKNNYFLNNIKLFLKQTGNNKILLDQFTMKIGEQLRMWIKINVRSTTKSKPCSIDHCNRHLKLCQRVFKFAMKQGYIKYNLLDALETKRGKTKPVVSLNATEFTLWKEKVWTVDIYKIAQILILFQCGSGLSYGDLWTFQVSTLHDGREWIVRPRFKNNQEYAVELSATCKEILEKCNGILPKITNQTYNSVIKEMAAILGIKKHLTTHVARKSFADIKYLEGYSIKAIGIMLGHKSTKTTETHYLNPGIDVIINERTFLEGRSSQ